MEILSKKRFMFKNGNDTFITHGKMAIETMPDWCKKDALYPLAVADGDILEVSTASAEAVQAKAVADDKEKTAKAKAVAKANGVTAQKQEVVKCC